MKLKKTDLVKLVFLVVLLIGLEKYKENQLKSSVQLRPQKTFKTIMPQQENYSILAALFINLKRIARICIEKEFLTSAPGA